MREYRVTSADGHVMTVQLDDEAAERLGATPVDRPDVEEHATTPVAAVETATTRPKKARRG